VRTSTSTEQPAAEVRKFATPNFLVARILKDESEKLNLIAKPFGSRKE
jgi:hypothetical protein